MFNRIRLHCHYEYNGDGRFPHLRIKGADKKYLGKWRRRVNKKMLEEEVEMAEQEANDQLVEYEIQHLSWWLRTMPSDHEIRGEVEDYLSSLLYQSNISIKSPTT